MPALFLSHSNKDREVVDRFKAVLHDRGYRSLFIDYDPDHGIPAGGVWERELYRNLKLSGAVIVLCSPDSMASRWCFAEIAQAKALGKAVFPVVIVPCEVDSVLTDRQSIDLTVAPQSEAYKRLFDGLRVAGLDPGDTFDWDPTRPPFPGFLHFGVQDAGIFFGRDAETRQVIETLTRLERQGEPRLLLLVGSSGSGKSSVVRAGVLPRLAKDRARWTVVAPFRPQGDPIGELARAVASAFPEGASRPDWKTVRDRLRDEGRAAGSLERSAPATSVLAEYADDLTMSLGHREASVLVVVDQAEELLQTDSLDDSSAFLNVLRRATERPGGRVFGLLTLRSDFLGSFQNHAAMRGALFAHLPLGLMPVANFPQVIEGPAARAEIALEPGLVSSMVADAQTDDALPLLAFTLREMYERCRQESRCTLKVYRDQLRGIKGAVARVVERIKAENDWRPDVGIALRRAFLKLVRVNDEGQFSRQPCRWADLPDLATQFLEAFVKARLLSSNGDIVEVTHESLFRVWPELAGWLDEGRELMLWKKIIQDDMNDWILHNRSLDRLLSGARVAEAARWLATSADDFPGPEAEFLRASIAAENDRIAKVLAEQHRLRRLSRRLGIATGVATALLVTSLIFGGYAFQKRGEAITQRDAAKKATLEATGQTRIANSRRIAALSARRDQRLDRRFLLAAEALRAYDTTEAEGSVSEALEAIPGLKIFLYSDDLLIDGVGAIISRVVFSPNNVGRTIAGSYLNGAALWNTATGKRLPLNIEADYVNSVAFSADGKSIAVGYGTDGGGGGGVKLVKVDADADDPSRTKLFSITEGEIMNLAFSPDGENVAVGYKTHHDQSAVLLLTLATGKRLLDTTLTATEGDIVSMAVSPDCKSVATGFSRSLVLWDMATGNRFKYKTLTVTEGGVVSAAFSPDGKTVAAAFSRGVMLWDVDTGKPLKDKTLTVNEGNVLSMAFSADSKTVAVGYGTDGSGGVKLLNLDLDADDPGRTKLFTVAGLDVQSVAFSPDGGTIAAGFSDGSGGGGVLLVDTLGNTEEFGADGIERDSGNDIARRIANRNFTISEWEEYFPDESYHVTFPGLPAPTTATPN